MFLWHWTWSLAWGHLVNICWGNELVGLLIKYQVWESPRLMISTRWPNSGWPLIIQKCSDCQFHLFPEYLRICPRKHKCLKWQTLWSGSTLSHSITGDVKGNLRDYAVTHTWCSFHPWDAPMQQSLVSFLAFDFESRIPTGISQIYSSWCHHTYIWIWASDLKTDVPTACPSVKAFV